MVFTTSLSANDFDTSRCNAIVEKIRGEGISLVVLDMNNKNVDRLLACLYDVTFSGVRIVDAQTLYEEIFQRTPLASLTYKWFAENISTASDLFYDFFKRSMDVVFSLIVGVITLPLYPFVWLAIKLDDGGPVLFIQERVGRGTEPIRIIKFRSMSEEGGDERNVTRVGLLLRNTRIDELPQLWNVLKGDLSLIGPRPEIPKLVRGYEAEIPYYSVRHSIKPGLSGWAQIYHEEHPHHGADVNETKMKLSYDLFYIKNRSLLLDFIITLKTIRTLLSRSGR